MGAAIANPVMSPNRTTVAASALPNPVVEWRRERLLAAGFGSDLAGRLAADCGIDLHALFELIDRGCPPELAARIVAPLDEGFRPC